MENDQVCSYASYMRSGEVLNDLRDFRVSSLTSTSPASARRPVSIPEISEMAYLTVLKRSDYLDRLITSKDHASVQISVVDVDADGRALPTSTTFALCGQVRAMGESDDSLNRLATKAGCEYLQLKPV